MATMLNYQKIIFTACISYADCLQDLAELEPPKVCSRCSQPVHLRLKHDATAIDILWVCKM